MRRTRVVLCRRAPASVDARSGLQKYSDYRHEKRVLTSSYWRHESVSERCRSQYQLTAELVNLRQEWTESLWGDPLRR